MNAVQGFVLGLYAGLILKTVWDRLDDLDGRIARIAFDGIARREREASSRSSEG